MSKVRQQNPKVTDQPVTDTEVEQTVATAPVEETPEVETETENLATQNSGTPPAALVEGVVSTAENENLGVQASSINDKSVETEPEVKVSEPVVQETKPNALDLQAQPGDEIQNSLEKLAGQVGTLGKTIVYNLKDYIAEMKPGRPMTPEKGVKHQVKLYRTLEMLFNNAADEDFQRIMPVLLGLFYKLGDESKESGVFGIQYVFRFPEYINLPSNEREAFSRWLNMLVNTANPHVRSESVKTLNWNYTLAYALTDDARSRLQAFYGV